MKKLIIAIGVLVGILGILIAFSAKSQHQPAVASMKLNAGIIKLKESTVSYMNILKFGHTPDHQHKQDFYRRTSLRSEVFSNRHFRASEFALPLN